MRKDFCIFILSHERADNVITTRIFDRNNYTGKWYIIVDNEDKTVEEYINNFGKDRIIVFDKNKACLETDRADNFDYRKTVVTARNEVFNIAKRLKIKYFIVFDDDYTSIDYRFSKDLVYKHNVIKAHIFEQIIEAMIKFFEADKRILSLTIAQGGDYIGGAGNKMGEKIRIKRKAMNSFLCSVDRPFKFVGNINEDVNTYCKLGQEGHIFVMLNQIALQQAQTQKQKGGLTTAYLNYGTYVKSFYSVLYCPSFVKISTTGYVEKRIHHKILWKNAVPCILNEKFKKS